MSETRTDCIPGSQAKMLLMEIADWEWVTTIVLHAGSVFEFKGPFPTGSEGHGFYNLQGEMPGFHGHLNLELVSHIRFQDKPHRGRESYAFVFENADDEVIFKVFLGRDESGELIASQVRQFSALQLQYQQGAKHEQ